MAIIIPTIAFLLCWIWIEITLYFDSKNTKEKNTVKRISYKKFVRILRVIIIILFFSVTIYTYFFQNISLQKAIEYCLGIIK